MFIRTHGRELPVEPRAISILVDSSLDSKRMRVFSILFLGLTLLVQLLCARHAWAQAPGASSAAPAKPIIVAPQPAAALAPNESPEYRAAIDAAVVEHDAGHFVEARAQFLRAHEISPNARTLRGLGMVEFELRNYGECVRYLEQALKSDVRSLDDDLRDETQALLERAKAYVGEVHVAVDPGTASVVVDGVTVASGPEASFVLVVGDHELEFRARGHLPEKRAINIRGGDQKTIRVTLSSPTAAEVGPTNSALMNTQASPRSERQPLVKKWWLWTAVGVVVAGATVATVLATRPDKEVRTDAPVQSGNPAGVTIMTLGSSQ